MSISKAVIGLFNMNYAYRINSNISVNYCNIMQEGKLVNLAVSLQLVARTCLMKVTKRKCSR